MPASVTEGARCSSLRDKCCKHVVNARVLKSVPLEDGKPGADQPAHADGTSAGKLRDRKVENVMLSAILAIEEEGTRLLTSLRVMTAGQRGEGCGLFGILEVPRLG